MKKNNEKPKKYLGKVGKVVATATMSAAILSPSIQSFAEPIQNNQSNKSQKEDQVQLAAKSMLSNLKITSADAQITKTVSNGTTKDTQYKPENKVPETGDIATIGTSFTYLIPIRFQSNNGENFNVNNIKFTTDINITGINGAPLTAQQEKLANALKQCIVTQIETNQVKSTEPSTSSFSVPISVTLNDSCYGLQINPVFHMNYVVNGQEGTYTIKLKPILTTKKYTETIAPTLTTTNDELGLQLTAANNGNASGNLIGLDPANLINGLNGQYKQKTYTFKLTPSDISTTKLVPIESPYLKDNGNGTYTISGPLLQEAYAGTANLFKIEYPDQLIAGTVSITPENPGNLSNFNNGNEINSANTIYYTGNDINIKHTPKPGTGTTPIDFYSLDSTDSGATIGGATGLPNAVKTQVSAKIDCVEGSGTAYLGSAIINGEAIASINNKVLRNTGVLVQLPENILNEVISGNIKEKAQIFNDIVSRKYPAFDPTMGGNMPQNFKPNFVYTSEGFSAKNQETISSTYYKVPKNSKQFETTAPTTASVTVMMLKYDDSTSFDKIQNAFQETLDPGNNQQIDGAISNNGTYGIVSAPASEAKALMDKVSVFHTGVTGYGRITDGRDGGFSHGISAASIMVDASSKVTIDREQKNIKTDNSSTFDGLDRQNEIEKHNIDWLSEHHTLNGVIVANQLLSNNEYAKGSCIEFNLGGPAEVVGNIVANGKVIPKSDYKYINGNTAILITLPAGLSSDVLKVQVPVQYTDMTLKNIQPTIIPYSQENYSTSDVVTSTTKLNGRSTEPGIFGMPAVAVPYETYSTVVSLYNSSNNQCQHYYLNMNNNNETTLNDTVTNNSGNTVTYTIAGELPQGTNDTLPAASGDPSMGNLGASLQSVNSNGAPIFLLPKDKLTGENKKILISEDAQNLADLTPAKLKELGWIEYKSGMNLSNYVGYIVKPTIQPGKSYNFEYGIKLEGVNPEVYQTTSSQFKYYEDGKNLGSLSPVATLYPNGEALGHSWLSSVVVQSYKKDANGKTIIASKSKLPTDILQNILSGKVTIKDLYNHGPDINQNDPFSLTPPKLMDLVNAILNGQAELEKLGYKLDYITVNDKNIAPNGANEFSFNKENLINWFNKTGISENTNLTHIHFILSKIDMVKNVNVEINNLTTNKVIDKLTSPLKGDPSAKINTKISEGNDGTQITINGQTLTIPKGYEVVDTITTNTDSNTQVSDIPNKINIPPEFRNYNSNVVINIKQVESSATTEVVGPNGEVVVPTSKPIEIKIGSPLNKVPVPTIPAGWKIVSINTNGKDGSSVIGDAQGSPNKIVYNVVKRKIGTVTTEIIDSTGKVLVNPATTSGYNGDKDTSIEPKIPNGYHLVKITEGILNDNGTVTPNDVASIGLPNEYNDGKQVVVWHVEKNETGVDITVKTIEGTIVVPTSTSEKIKTGEPLASVSLKNQEDKIPYGYKIIGYETNGETSPVIKVNGNAIANDTNETPNHITIIVKKEAESNITTEVVSTTGEVLVPSVTTANKVVGSSTKGIVKAPKIPNGYHLVKITTQGGDGIPGIPSTFPNKDQTITWVVAKNDSKVTVSVTGEDGNPIKGVTPADTTTTVPYGTPLTNGLVPKIPAHYHITGITVNGKTEAGNKITETTNTPETHIVVKIAKDGEYPVAGKVVTTDGKVLSTNKTTDGFVGDTWTETPTIPAGYHLVKTTLNGNEVKVSKDNGVTGKYENRSQEVVWTVAKDDSKVTVSVTGEDGNPIKGVTPADTTTTVPYGTPLTNGLVPKIPEHYHITGITVNGKTEAGNKITGTTNTPETHVVVKIAKDGEYPVGGKVVTTDGKVLSTNKTTDGFVGDTWTETPTIPAGYHLVKTTLNGNEVKVSKDNGVTGKYENRSQEVVWTVAKDDSKVTVSVTGEDGNPIKGVTPADTTTTVPYGTPLTNGLVPKIPAHYHITGITVNGKTEAGNKITGTTDTPETHVVIKIAKDGEYPVAGKVVTTDGKVLSTNKTTDGFVGDTWTETPTVPAGYHLVKTTLNGNAVKVSKDNGVTGKYDNGSQEIVWTVAKDVVGNKTTTSTTNTNSNSNNGAGIVTNSQTNGVHNAKIDKTINTNNTNAVNAEPQNVETKNPKTGDNANIPFGIGLMGAIAGLFAINKRSKKEEKVNKTDK